VYIAAPPVTEQNRNLLIRVITAFLWLIPVLWTMWMGDLWWAFMVGFVGTMSAAEFADIFGGDLRTKIVWGVIAAGWPTVLWFVPEYALWYAPAAIMLIMADRLLREEPLERAPQMIGLGIFSLVYGSMLISALMPLRVHGWEWIFLALSLGFLNDTCAYFAGRFLGRHKLYPRISPSKTWEGWIGGLAGSIGAAFFARYGLDAIWPGVGAPLAALLPLDCVALGILAAVVGPIGDLSESMLKRAVGIKDSGIFFPGHGGWLDRVDAVSFIAPTVLLYASWRLDWLTPLAR
jgi:phosphatidate cytidylyltransferase